MNKLTFFCLISLITAIYACPVWINYQTRKGKASIDIDNPSTISCEEGETLVSCGIIGLHAIQGTYIDPNNPNTCIAGTSISGFSVKAVATCGKFPPRSIKANTITSEGQRNNQVLTQCPSGSTLTGCQVDRLSGTTNNIRGSYPGQQQSTNTPPAQVGKSGISTMNQCIAEARSDSTKIRGGAQCLETIPNYGLGMNFDLRQCGTIIMY